MTKHEQVMEAFKIAKEGAKKQKRESVNIEGFRSCRKYILRVIGGIVDGVQSIDFDDRQSAEDYALDELRPFYKKMGKRVTVNLEA